jgi:hypothetical protein
VWDARFGKWAASQSFALQRFLLCKPYGWFEPQRMPFFIRMNSGV